MNTLKVLVVAIALAIGLSERVEGSCQTSLKFGSLSKQFSACSSLAAQGAELAYTRNGTILEIGFSNTATASGGWVGWGINPTQQGKMAGSSALVAFSNSSGSYLYEYQLTSAQNSGITPHPSSNGTVFAVLDKAVEINGTSMRFYARLNFSSAPGKLYHIWNRGSQVVGDAPQMHSLSDLNSYGSIDVSTAAQSDAPEPSPSPSQESSSSVILSSQHLAPILVLLIAMMLG